MIGTHDTLPIGIVAERWVESGASRRQAEYLASRLLAEGEDREAWAAAVARNPGELAQARLADLFVGPARNVMIYFTDLLGERAAYNTPGTVSDANWSLRIPPDVGQVYGARVAAGRALDVPRALARALRSRGPAFAAAHGALLAGLEAAGRPRP
jgi:4-alpha-glucanotransferase